MQELMNPVLEVPQTVGKRQHTLRKRLFILLLQPNTNAFGYHNKGFLAIAPTLFHGETSLKLRASRGSQSRFSPPHIYSTFDNSCYGRVAFSR